MCETSCHTLVSSLSTTIPFVWWVLNKFMLDASIQWFLMAFLNHAPRRPLLPSSCTSTSLPHTNLLPKMTLSLFLQLRVSQVCLKQELAKLEKNRHLKLSHRQKCSRQPNWWLSLSHFVKYVSFCHCYILLTQNGAAAAIQGASETAFPNN